MTGSRGADITVVRVTAAATTRRAATVIIAIAAARIVGAWIFIVGGFYFFIKFIKITARIDVGKQNLAALVLINIHVSRLSGDR